LAAVFGSVLESAFGASTLASPFGGGAGMGAWPAQRTLPRQAVATVAPTMDRTHRRGQKYFRGVIVISDAPRLGIARSPVTARERDNSRPVPGLVFGRFGKTGTNS